MRGARLAFPHAGIAVVLLMTQPGRGVASDGVGDVWGGWPCGVLSLGIVPHIHGTARRVAICFGLLLGVSVYD